METLPKDNNPQPASQGILTDEVRNILSEAASGVPAEIWKAIAMAEQIEPPAPAPSFVYTSLGTAALNNAVPR